MKTLKSVLAVSVMVAFASAGALADEGEATQEGQRGFARNDDYPAYNGIGEKKDGVEETRLTTLSTQALDPSDEFPGAGEDEPGFGNWGPCEAGNVQPGLGTPWSGPRPPQK